MTFGPPPGFPPAPGFGAPPPAFGNTPGFGAPPAAPPRAPEPGSVRAWDLDLQGYTPSLVNECACCSASSQTSLAVRFARTRGRVSETRVLQVPYCEACARHVKAAVRRNWMLGLIATFTALPVPFLLAAVWTYAPGALIVSSGLLFAIALNLMLGRIWSEPTVTPQCAGTHHAVAITGFFGNVTKVRVRSAQYAQKLAAQHQAVARPSRRAGTTSPRHILAPLFALIAGVPGYLLTHGTVYFDNPGTQAITFSVDDDSASVTVQPGTAENMRLPRGDRHFALMANGQTYDRFDGEVDMAGDHLVSPYGAGCYAVITAGYGTARGTAAQPQVLVGRRFYTLEHVNLFFEPFPTSVSVSQGQSGATRRRLARVRCDSGEIVN